MPANNASDAKLLSDLQKFAASVGIPFPAHNPPASAPPPASTPATPSPEPAAATPRIDPGSGNAAVDRCLEAYAEDCRKRIAAGQDKNRARFDAKAAYTRAMPPLIGPQNVADFIACVTRGIIEEVISGAEITQFLYAAQVANTVKNITTPSAPKRPRGRPGTEKNALHPTDKDVNSSVNTPSEN